MRFIVLEGGASGFEPPSPFSDEAMEVTVLVQAEGEPSDELEARVMRRLAQIERSDRVVLEAVIAAGGASAESRARLALALFTHITEHGAGEIVLAAADPRAELRLELMSLAEALTRQSNPGKVGVRVLFALERPDDEDVELPRCSDGALERDYQAII